MITEKEAWESSNPDTFLSLAHTRIKELWVVCVWYSRHKTRYSAGFASRAAILQVLMEGKRHKFNLISGWIAAIISLIGAAASWYAALHSRQDVQAASIPNNIQPEFQSYKQQTTDKKSETKREPEILAPTVPKTKKAPEQLPSQKETLPPPADSKAK